MKSKTNLKKAQEALADANARVELFKELGNGTTLINKIRSGFPARTYERGLLKLATNALFYVSVRQLDGFCAFLEEMDDVDGVSKKKKRPISKQSGQRNNPGKSKSG